MNRLIHLLLEQANRQGKERKTEESLNLLTMLPSLNP